MPGSNPPGLPAELSRPDAQLIVDALNVRLHTLEKKTPVQTADGSERKIAFGVKELTYPGASQESGSVEVEHGLGVEPQAVNLTPLHGTTGGYGELEEVTKIKIKFKAKNPFSEPEAGLKVKMYWTVIG